MSSATTPMQRAVDHHTQGRFAEAEAAYREVLRDYPNNPDALNLLGVACSQQGRRDEAIGYIQRAISLHPGGADFHSNLALVYAENGQIENALASARAAVALRPNHVEAMFILGNALRRLGRYPEAQQWLERSLSIRPDQPEALTGLADVYRQMGRMNEADAIAKRLLEVRPTSLEGLAVRGETLLAQRRFHEAAAVFQSVIDAYPNSWVGYNGLGVARVRQGRAAEAAPLYKKSIELAKTSNPCPYNNAGFACIGEGQIEEAIEHFEKALEIRADFPEVHTNLGNAYGARLELDRAMAAYNRALFFQPDNQDAHWNKSLLLLLQGKFAEGFLEYEWRWLKFLEHRQSFRQPRWDGYDITGKTILLHSEQGFGDTIQFARFAEIVRACGADVILGCGEELVSLLSSMNDKIRVVARGKPSPPFDVHCPLLSLPYALGITVDTIPGKTPYVFANESLRSRWRQALVDLKGMKVGICWGGDSEHTRNSDRSASLELFGALRDLAGVDWVSLQKGAPRREPMPAGFDLIDMTDELHDFADTAALIANLDLVISVDTAVAHLAGALGKAVWTLVSYAPDWRWLLDREDSPWYPTMRLFRQRTRRDWAEVLGRVHAALEEFLNR